LTACPGSSSQSLQRDNSSSSYPAAAIQQQQRQQQQRQSSSGGSSRFAIRHRRSGKCPSPSRATRRRRPAHSPLRLRRMANCRVEGQWPSRALSSTGRNAAAAPRAARRRRWGWRMPQLHPLALVEGRRKRRPAAEGAADAFQQQQQQRQQPIARPIA